MAQSPRELRGFLQPLLRLRNSAETRQRVTRYALRAGDSRQVADGSVGRDSGLAARELHVIFAKMPSGARLRVTESASTAVGVRSSASSSAKVTQRRPSTDGVFPHAEQLLRRVVAPTQRHPINQRPLERRAPVVQFLLQLAPQNGSSGNR